MLRVLKVLTVVGLVVTAWSAAASADPTGYSVNAVSDPGFYSIDLATGAATQIGPNPQMGGLAFGPNGLLYGVVDVGTDTLATIDITNGTVSPIGTGINLPSGNDLLNSGLTFGADGRLWISAITTDANEWYEIDTSTGEAIGNSQVLLQGLVGDPNERVTGLAARCDGAIFGMDGDTQFYEIDPDTATASPIGSPAGLVTIPSGIDFAADGTLWGMTFGANPDTFPSEAFVIDPTTGAISDVTGMTIGGNSTSTFSGLGIASTPSECPPPTPPEPTAASPLVLAPTFTG